MNTKLDANTASHQNAMHMVQQLSQVIVSMSERMENMERLLHLLLENQQVILQMHMMLLLHACIKNCIRGGICKDMLTICMHAWGDLIAM